MIVPVQTHPRGEDPHGALLVFSNERMVREAAIGKLQVARGAIGDLGGVGDVERRYGEGGALRNVRFVGGPPANSNRVFKKGEYGVQGCRAADGRP